MLGGRVHSTLGVETYIGTFPREAPGTILRWRA